MEQKKYYPLHVHTSIGSVGDSILGVSDYVAKAKEYGLEAVAVTDHGSMSAIYTLARECNKQGIRPIFGMEAYVVDDNSLKDKEHGRGKANHLVLLAKNEEGMRNLFSIHNQAATEGFYYEARSDWEHLRMYGKGIIALSACVGGEIPQAILRGDDDQVLNLIGFYKECFEEFYLELQPGSFEDQLVVNRRLVKLAHETETPLIVTNDIHYLAEDDAIRHDYHVKLGRKSKTNEGVIYPDTCYWFMNREQLKNSFVYDDVVTKEIVDRAIDVASKVAGVCHVELNTELHMPAFPLEGDKTEEEELYRMCFSRLNRIIENKPNPQDYVDRLTYELDVIKEKGFCGYFLIVQDYVNWARKNGVPVGPGRGSAAGSLVANVLGITQADPIKYGLLFERFLDPHREAIPDVDVDFGPAQRDRMFKYVVDKYGHDCCSLVSTLGTRKAKGAIHDAARILGYEVSVGNEIAKLIPDVYYGDEGEKKTDLDIKSSLEVTPALRKMQESYPDIIKLAMDLEGITSSKGIHAAGVIVSPVSLVDMAPLIKPNKEGILATSLTLGDAEQMLVKFDFLGLATLETMQAVEQEVGWKFDFQDDSLLEDDAVWDIIGSRNTTGIFQISSKTYKDRMPRLKPRSLDELAACLALVRGPSISSKTDEQYMQIIEGKAEIQQVHPLYDEITKDTNGILIFQEQVMHLAVAFGMDLTTGYKIIKLAAKKKIAKLEEYRQKFIPLALEKDCDETTANKLFDMIVKSGEYSFNKSHAVSYALITYASAYLKVHYPLEYARALLSHVYEDGKDKEYAAVVDDCRRQGIQFLPADIVKSNWEFSIEDGKLRVGLCAVKGLGKVAIDAIEPLKAQFEQALSIEEFLGIIAEAEVANRFNKKAVMTSIFAGLLDRYRIGDTTRLELAETYVAIRAKKGEEVPEEIKVGKEVIRPQADDEIALESAFFSNNFIHDPANALESFGWDELAQKSMFETLAYVRKIKKTKTKTGEQMAFVTLATGDGIIEGIAFPKNYQAMKKEIKDKRMVGIRAIKENSDSCILKEAVLWKEIA